MDSVSFILFSAPDTYGIPFLYLLAVSFLYCQPTYECLSYVFTASHISWIFCFSCTWHNYRWRHLFLPLSLVLVPPLVEFFTCLLHSLGFVLAANRHNSVSLVTNLFNLFKSSFFPLFLKLFHSLLLLAVHFNFTFSSSAHKFFIIIIIIITEIDNLTLSSFNRCLVCFHSLSFISILQILFLFLFVLEIKLSSINPMCVYIYIYIYVCVADKIPWC